MASASLSRVSFNDVVEKALEAHKDSSIESLTININLKLCFMY